MASISPELLPWLRVLILATASLIVTHGILPRLDVLSGPSRMLAIAVCLALKAIYLTWRVLYSLPAFEWSFGVWFAYGFFALEVVLEVAAVRAILVMRATVDRSTEASRHERWYASDGTRNPKVAILIPTYNEPRSVLEKTVVGALAQDHPGVDVWVLDDGGRDWVKVLCQEVGVNYLSRAEHEDAKAGNLNAALDRLEETGQSPDFIAVLDADFVPCRDFVRRTLAMMHEPRVGLVQTPQYYFNRDPFQARFVGGERWPDSQRCFYNAFLVSLDARDKANCCGTSFLVRYRALVDIGGFPTEAVTEDVLTTIKLARKGWKTRYLCEQLSAGLAPEGIHEYLTQRARWCLGITQIGMLLWRQSVGKPIWTRLSNIEKILRWPYTSTLRLLYWLAPLGYYFFGWHLFHAPATEVLTFLLPLILYQRAFQTWINRGSHLPVFSEAEQILSYPALIPAFITGLFRRKSHRFVVTDKGAARESGRLHSRAFKQFAFYLVLVVVGIGWRATQGFDTALAYVYMYMNLTPFLATLVAAIACFELPRRRQEVRLATNEQVGLISDSGVLHVRARDISVSGLSAAGQFSAEQLRDVSAVRLEDVGDIPVDLVRAGSGVMAFRFVPSTASKRALIQKLFCGRGYVRPVSGATAGTILDSLVRTLLAGRFLLVPCRA